MFAKTHLLSFDSLHESDSSHIPWSGLIRELSYDKLKELEERFEQKKNHDIGIDEKEFKKIIRNLFGMYKVYLYKIVVQ